MAQITQANRMICQQEKEIEKQGGSPGAVVVVQVNYQAVSHAIGIHGGQDDSILSAIQAK